jgi:hypothetical protein
MSQSTLRVVPPAPVDVAEELHHIITRLRERLVECGAFDKQAAADIEGLARLAAALSSAAKDEARGHEWLGLSPPPPPK